VPCEPDPVPENPRAAATAGAAQRYRARRDRIVAELLAELGDTVMSEPTSEPDPGAPGCSGAADGAQSKSTPWARCAPRNEE
jgi:hypothetical protein